MTDKSSNPPGDNRPKDHNEQTAHEYGDAIVTLLELVWGEGYLSPGGPDEVARVLDGLDLGGRHLLDIGCGTGGIDIHLVERFGAARVTGVDIEVPNIEMARERAAKAGLSDRIAFQAVEPGPLPFADCSFDAVFSKDSVIHIPDKEAFFRDAWRITRNGGLFAASDWLRGDDNPPSPEMRSYIEAEGLSFAMASPRRYEAAMKAAGYQDVELRDRNAWYCETAAHELAQMRGPLHARILDLIGPEETEREIRVWEAMLVVLRSGELRPTHLVGHKPG